MKETCPAFSVNPVAVLIHSTSTEEDRGTKRLKQNINISQALSCFTQKRGGVTVDNTFC